ncbi:MAG: hypothetical protein Q9175_008252, partial [Cornicularia normoerica]
VGEAAAQTTIEDSIAFQPQRSVVEDAEARGGWPLHGVVELELVVGDNFTGTVFLVSEDTVVKGDDRVGGAGGLALGWNLLCDVVRSDFKGAGIIFIAAAGTLGCDDGGQGGEESDGGEGLHGEDVMMRWKRMDEVWWLSVR